MKVCCENCRYGILARPYYNLIPQCCFIANTTPVNSEGKYNVENNSFWKAWEKRGHELSCCIGAWKRKDLYYFRKNSDGKCPFYKRKWWKFWVK